jgi:hypothetical protein
VYTENVDQWWSKWWNNNVFPPRQPPRSRPVHRLFPLRRGTLPASLGHRTSPGYDLRESHGAVCSAHAIRDRERSLISGGDRRRYEEITRPQAASGGRKLGRRDGEGEGDGERRGLDGLEICSRLERGRQESRPRRLPLPRPAGSRNKWPSIHDNAQAGGRRLGRAKARPLPALALPHEWPTPSICRASRAAIADSTHAAMSTSRVRSSTKNGCSYAIAISTDIFQK